jgi:5-methylcytosine-specific restriction endonuclease McrA
MHCLKCHKPNDGTLIRGKKEVCDECLSIQIPCHCGCGTLRSKYDQRGRERKCIYGHWTEETKQKMSDFKKGGNNPMYGKHQSGESNRKNSESHLGEKNGHWKGGITPIVHLIRCSAKYKQWRQDILKRDGYVCQGHGDKHCSNLNAHHKNKSFSVLVREIKCNLSLFDLYTEAMMYKPLWNLDNGITLCEDCHKKERKKIGG